MPGPWLALIDHALDSTNHMHESNFYLVTTTDSKVLSANQYTCEVQRSSSRKVNVKRSKSDCAVSNKTH
jgi:hypothetical protein